MRQRDSGPAEELRRARRGLVMLTRATEALIHANDEQQLLNRICRILVEEGEYLFCWVGYVQHDDKKSIWPVARFGDDGGFIAKARLSWDESKPGGRTPSGAAVRTGLPQLARGDGAQGVSELAPGVRSAFGAILSLPLMVEGRTIGMLTLYSSDREAFDEEEVRLMDNLARNVSYGIGTQRVQFERGRAERELKESEARYRVLVETAPDAILVHTQGVIIFSNHSADGLFHAGPGLSLMGRRIGDLIHKDTTLSEDFSRIDGAGGETTMVEAHLARLDGSGFIAEVTFSPIVFHGVHARQMIVRDITERKQVHAQLVQTAKLATLGEMAASMAHELSQPLNIMRMAAEGALMLIGREKASQDYQVKQFAMIAAQAGRMAEIIDHIRIFSRKDSGAVELFDARGTLQLAVDLMVPQLSSEDIRIDAVLPAGAVYPVMGRPVQLEQVIVNLLSNAADAIKEARTRTGEARSGVVTLTAAVERNARLRLTVTDNGPGIAEEDLDRIFEPFFTTKEVGRGTGLGLSVSFGIISSMGGRMSADPTPPGQGASFSITLPLQDCPMPAGGEACGGKEPRENPLARHLLLVDDEPQAIENMSAYFNELGYRTTRAHSGNAALKLFSRDPADLVVTDIRMADGDGEMLIRQLRDVAPDLPIVVVTGHIGRTEILTREPANDRLKVIKKPVSLATMAETIEEMLHVSQ